jgi:hypothetical protein
MVLGNGTLKANQRNRKREPRGWRSRVPLNTFRIYMKGDFSDRFAERIAEERYMNRYMNS